MDMKKILENMDSAAAGERPAAGADAGSMKAILESINKVQEAPIEECGDNMMASQEMPMAQGGQEVTVSVTASGKENVADLISLMQQAAGIDAPQAPMAHDHGHEPEMDMPEKGQEMDMATMRAIMSAGDEREEAEADAGDEVEEWSNSPEGSEGEEQYIDHEYMTRDLSGGLNREKPKGAERVKDPAIEATESIKEKLWAALSEKKTAEGRGAVMAGRGRGKKKLKASRGNEDIKTTEGRGKGRGKKKSRG